MLKKVKFKGGFFVDETELDLFANDDRLSLLYGKNGSGKSTISKVVSKAKGNVVEEIGEVTLYDQEDKVYTDVQSIHVFNEDYINSRVRLLSGKLSGASPVTLNGGQIENNDSRPAHYLYPFLHVIFHCPGFCQIKWGSIPLPRDLNRVM